MTAQSSRMARFNSDQKMLAYLVRELGTDAVTANAVIDAMHVGLVYRPRPGESIWWDNSRGHFSRKRES